jgi:type I restriction enzyme M protein
MAVKKTQLYSHLWEAANALRGGMDASQYKDYVLTILFIKYVTDRYKGDPYAEFLVPEGGSFDDLIEAKGKSDIGERINKVLAKLAEENELKGVIDRIDFDDSSKLGTGKEKVDRLTSLVAIFENPDLNFKSNRAEGDDILGDVYEYFMKKFATEAGKSKGQFYTPAEVSRIMAKIIGVDKVSSPDQTAYDPTCGSGSLLLKVADEAKSETGIDISLYGQDKDIDVANLARMNMIMHGRPDAVIEQGNTLADPKFKNDDSLKTFDFVVANPPFSQKNWMNGVKVENDPYHRFDDGIPPAKNGDYAFLLHLIKSLKPKGKGAIILPHGVLFRGGAEAVIRRNLVQKGYIKGIIGLPPNLFYGTGIPAIIMVIDKENASARKGIFMIDASKGFRKDGAKNRLRERDIHKIVTTFHNFDEIPGYSRMVSMEEIKNNDYNLNIPRYIDSTEEEDIQDIYAHLHDGIPRRDIDMMEAWAVFPQLKEALFDLNSSGYYEMKIQPDQLQDFIEKSPEVQHFINQAMPLFDQWKHSNLEFMKSIDENTNPRHFIRKISESLLDTYRTMEIVDEYAIYQILMDYWDEEMKDDVYMLIEEGWVAKTYRILEKNKKGKEVDKGWTCDLLPKEIVIKEYFDQEKEKIEQLETQLEEIQQKMEEMKEEYGGEEGILEEVKNQSGNITKKELLAKIKELKTNEDEFKDELTVLLDYQKLMDQEAKIKKQIKTLEKELDEKLLQKYSQLSEDDVKRLVVEKKWLARLQEGIRDELDNIILEISNRVKELAERYDKPLPEIEKEVEEYEKKVKEHLKIMGFKFNFKG